MLKLTVVMFCSCISMASATFLFNQTLKADAANICIYSKDPNKYGPKCFLCPNKVYPNALLACVNVTSMPNNISYSQANCIEKNCAINYPEATQPKLFEKSIDIEQVVSFMNLIKKTLVAKRSVPENQQENSIDDPRADAALPLDDDSKRILLQLKSINLSNPNQNIHITQQVETYASQMDIEYDDY